MKRSSAAFGALVTVGVFGLFGLRIASLQSRAAAPARELDPAVLVGVESPARVTIIESVRMTGVVRPRREVEVIGKVAGRIQTLHAAVGDSVQAGALLCIVEHVELGFQRQQASAQLEAAEAQVLQARLQLAAAQTQKERVATLESGGAVAQAEGDRATLGFKSAEAGLRAAQAQLRLSQAVSGLAGRALQNSRVTAPIAGTITKRNVSVGTQVGPGDPLFHIQDLAELTLDGAVSASDYVRLAPGQTASITVEELPGAAISGTVATLSPMLDAATRRAAVQISIGNSDGRLLSNMFAHAVVAIGKRAGVLTVPPSATVTLPSGRFVYVLRDGRARAIELPANEGDADHVIVEGRLTERDRVIVHGQSTLVDGQFVRVGSDSP